MKSLHIVLACIAAIGLAGCTSVAPPVLDKADESRSLFLSAPFHGEHTVIDTDSSGSEKYRLYATGTTGFALLSEIRQTVETHAAKFCGEKHKKVKVLEQRTSVGPHVANNYPRFEIVFVCVDK